MSNPSLLQWAKNLETAERITITSEATGESKMVVMVSDDAAKRLGETLRDANHRLVFMHEELRRNGYAVVPGKMGGDDDRTTRNGIG